MPETESKKIAQLKKLRSLARELGFEDDVEHWTQELTKLGVED